MDGSQKNPQQQVYQQQQRQNQQQQYQWAPTKNLNQVSMRQTVNSQPALNNQLLGAGQMYLPSNFQYSSNSGYPTMVPYPMQYGAVVGYRPHPNYITVYFAPTNMAFAPTPRGTTPQMATATPVQSMPPGTTIPQQSLMTSQMAPPPVVAQQPVVALPIQRKRASCAVPIVNPLTKEPVIGPLTTPSVDASETVSHKSFYTSIIYLVYKTSFQKLKKKN